MRIAPLVLLMCLMWLMPSCYSFKEGQIDPNLQSVSIYNFTNTSLNGNSAVAQKLSEALRNRFLTQTNLKLVDRNGDIEFRGTIVGYDIVGTAISSNETTNQNRLSVTVNIEFVNNQDEKQNFTQRFEAFADYDSSRNFADVEEELQDDIFFQLVEKIYNKALVNW